MGMKWLKAEEQLLRYMANVGYSSKVIANTLKRSTHAIWDRRYLLQIPTNPARCKRTDISADTFAITMVQQISAQHAKLRLKPALKTIRPAIVSKTNAVTFKHTFKPFTYAASTPVMVQDTVQDTAPVKSHRRRWTTDDETRLIKYFKLGGEPERIAELMGRTVGSVASHLHKLGYLILDKKMMIFSTKPQFWLKIKAEPNSAS
jgi:hypothetical protein